MAAVCLGGCFDADNQDRRSTPAGKSDAAKSSPVAGESKTPEDALAEARRLVQSSRDAAKAQDVPPAPALPIRLYDETVLEQTTAEGTMMSFSVEYEFAGTGPDPTVQYMLAMQRADGESMKRPEPLARQGTLSAFTPGWRSQHGPFRMHIEDADGKPLSNVMTLTE
jgi:hypothetical protein